MDNLKLQYTKNDYREMLNAQVFVRNRDRGVTVDGRVPTRRDGQQLELIEKMRRREGIDPLAELNRIR